MDPSGDYSVDDVTVELDGVEITKGDNAKGSFVHIGPNKSYFTTTKGAVGDVTRNKRTRKDREVTITVLRSSSSHSKLSSARQQPKVTLTIRRRTGEPLFDGDAFVEERNPIERGDERVWFLSAMFD